MDDEFIFQFLATIFKKNETVSKRDREFPVKMRSLFPDEALHVIKGKMCIMKANRTLIP